MSQKKEELFQTDPDFCPRCGSILPVPGCLPEVTCRLCHFSIDVTEFDETEVHTKIVFNKREPCRNKQKDSVTESKGLTTEKKCEECGHDAMIYSIREIKSANKQGVCFTCPMCRYRIVDYS